MIFNHIAEINEDLLMTRPQFKINQDNYFSTTARLYSAEQTTSKAPHTPSQAELSAEATAKRVDEARIFHRKKKREEEEQIQADGIEIKKAAKLNPEKRLFAVRNYLEFLKETTPGSCRANSMGVYDTGFLNDAMIEKATFLCGRALHGLSEITDDKKLRSLKLGHAGIWTMALAQEAWRRHNQMPGGTPNKWEMEEGEVKDADRRAQAISWEGLKEFYNVKMKNKFQSGEDNESRWTTDLETSADGKYDEYKKKARPICPNYRWTNESSKIQDLSELMKLGGDPWGIYDKIIWLCKPRVVYIPSGAPSVMSLGKQEAVSRWEERPRSVQSVQRSRPASFQLKGT